MCNACLRLLKSVYLKSVTASGHPRFVVVIASKGRPLRVEVAAVEVRSVTVEARLGSLAPWCCRRYPVGVCKQRVFWW